MHYDPWSTYSTAFSSITISSSRLNSSYFLPFSHILYIIFLNVRFLSFCCLYCHASQLVILSGETYFISLVRQWLQFINCCIYYYISFFAVEWEGSYTGFRPLTWDSIVPLLLEDLKAPLHLSCQVHSCNQK